MWLSAFLNAKNGLNSLLEKLILKLQCTINEKKETAYFYREQTQLNQIRGFQKHAIAQKLCCKPLVILD